LFTSGASAAPLQVNIVHSVDTLVDTVDNKGGDASAEQSVRNIASNLLDHEFASEYDSEVANPALNVVDFYTSMTVAEMREKSQELMAAGYYTEAIDSIQQLQGAIHRLHGVDTIEQAESIVWLIECYSALNQYEQVDQQQVFLFSLATHTFDEQDPRFQFARMRMANWYLRSLRYQRALTLYNVIAEWAEQELPADNGDQRIILLMALRGEALARYVSGKCCASELMLRVHEITSASEDFDLEDRRNAKQDYVNILFLERNHAEAAPLLQTLAEERDVTTSPILLGFSHPSDMDTAMRRINHQSSDWVKSYNPNNNGNTMVFQPTSEFPVVSGDPVSICGKHLVDLVTGKNRDRLSKLYVDVSMRIDKKGRATDIQMKGNTTAKIRRYLTQSIRKSRFRPGMSATGKVAADRFEFRQVFTTPAQPRIHDVSSWNRVLASHTCQLSSL
jgi:hypothetical protein